MLLLLPFLAHPLAADSGTPDASLSLELRYQEKADAGVVTKTREEVWAPEASAIIVTDMWDLHHSLNATRRLTEFAPRLDDVLSQAREQGVTIIHAPSDTMEFYAGHPARERAMAMPTADTAPPGVDQWCLQVPPEEEADYPIDQFDGGEDDAPEELAAWARHLEELGRNPGIPWKKQTALLRIDPERDFISSHGDEVWNILEARGIDNVILTGVHLNMCVLGRPFGLRQMLRGGKNTVLMRDMTDTMYNPDRWPYVDHFTGTDLMVAYVERNLCPTITSDQFVGGEPFRFKNDTRSVRGPEAVAALEAGQFDNGEAARLADPAQRWVKVSIPPGPNDPNGNKPQASWYRSVLRLPEAWEDSPVRVTISSDTESYRAWINGRPLDRATRKDGVSFDVPKAAMELGSGNLLVIQVADGDELTVPPSLHAGDDQLTLEGYWQMRVGNDRSFATIPLPPKFAAAADIVFEPPDTLR